MQEFKFPSTYITVTIWLILSMVQENIFPREIGFFSFLSFLSNQRKGTLVARDEFDQVKLMFSSYC